MAEFSQDSDYICFVYGYRSGVTLLIQLLCSNFYNGRFTPKYGVGKACSVYVSRTADERTAFAFFMWVVMNC